jgi:hypothetical protein
MTFIAGETTSTKNHHYLPIIYDKSLVKVGVHTLGDFPCQWYWFHINLNLSPRIAIPGANLIRC